MGEADRHIEYKERRNEPGLRFSINSPIILLISINFTAFLFIQLFQFGNTMGDTAIAPFFYEKMHLFLVPAGVKDFLFQPWSIITYSFFHIHFFSLISNMLWLWGFGSILQSLAGNRHSFPVYLYGAVAGAIAFVAINYFHPILPAYPLEASNASIMAIALAATSMAPNYRLFQHIGRGIPLWVFTLLYAIVDLVGLGGVSIHHYITHLAGAVMGIVYMLLYNRGYDLGAWMNQLYEWCNGIFMPATKTKKASIKDKVFYHTGNRNPYQKTAHITEQRIDAILDKISQQGYDSLNKEEKEILKKASDQ
ncbi:MAG: rhomboid family intramembrane serine protease [Chitinophagaceae bacterium]